MTLDDRSFPDPANLTLRSSAGALLAGILLDEHHQPIRNVEVTALERQPQYGRPRFVPVANDVTEADGSYCIQVPIETRTAREIAASGPVAAGDDGRGEFLVGVIPTGTWLPHPAWAVTVVPLTGRPPTYFPSVTTSAEARVLSPQRGEARRDLNFALQSARLTRIDGDILGAYPPALPASDVVLEPPDEDVAIYRRASPDAQRTLRVQRRDAGRLHRAAVPEQPDGRPRRMGYQAGDRSRRGRTARRRPVATRRRCWPASRPFPARRRCCRACGHSSRSMHPA